MENNFEFNENLFDLCKSHAANSGLMLKVKESDIDKILNEFYRSDKSEKDMAALAYKLKRLIN